jgi:ABC-2 type transport system ATP-binding protein
MPQNGIRSRPVSGEAHAQSEARPNDRPLATPAMQAVSAIRARDVTKRFGRVEAVRDLSFDVPTACVCGLLGPNGAGKTTTLRMIAGLLVPDAGSLAVAGVDLSNDPDEARRRVGYLPESAPIHPELRTSEFLRYRAELIGLGGKAARAAIERAVTSCDLGPVYGRLVGALSKGYRQRVGVAAAILGDPSLVILDEPSVGLDPHQLLAFRALLRELGRERTVLLSSHILAEVEAVCDTAVLLAGGRLVATGPLAALRREGGERYVIEARGQESRTLLADIAGLGSIREEALDDGWLRLTAHSAVNDPTDRREAIAIAFAGRGVRVRELRREQASLESLFLRATAAGSFHASPAAGSGH